MPKDIHTERLAIVSAPGRIGGAGLAAFRIWQSLTESGVNCDFVSAKEILHSDRSVSPLSSAERWAAKLAGKLMGMSARRAFPTAPGSNFQTWRPRFSTRAWRGRFAKYDLIDWHVPGRQFLGSLQASGNLAQRNVVTLHDMWFLTGGCNYSFQCRDYAIGCPNCPLLGSERERMSCREQMIEKVQTVEQRVHAVVSPTKWLADCAQRSLGFRSVPAYVVPHSVSGEEYRPHDRAQCRHQFGIAPTDFVIGFGAQNLSDERKGWKVLKEALGQLPETSRSQLLLLFFGGSAVPEVNVRFKALGKLETSEALCRAYSAMDIFVCSSLADNSPNTVVEAQFCGTPVVGSDAGGTPEMIEAGISGLVVPAGDAPALSKAIASCLPGDIHERWSVRAREFAKARWLPSVSVNRRLEVYRSTASIHG